MTLVFSDKPGSRERQLQRQYNNPLFSEQQRTITDIELKKVQAEDLQELEVFSQAFQKLFEEASQLADNVQSDVILKLKENADKLYERAACLPGENSTAQESLLKLIAIIMRAIKQGAGDDAKALSELEQETQARAMHIELMKIPLVADMLNPDSLIDADNLAATLLSVSHDELEAGLTLFQEDQITHLYNDAETLILDCAEKGYDMTSAKASLALIADALRRA